jgi:hypothetical protein
MTTLIYQLQLNGLTVALEKLCTRITSSSAISTQLEARLVTVRAIKLICKLSLPLRVYGPMRLTHKHSQVLVMTVLCGRCQYLRSCLLLIWQDLQDFTFNVSL